ncbi:MAG: ABC transporter permease [Syntrophobacteraceae bacterium]|jgi:peptide/nickel transport system permease protein|nr:ABC transporter permease [Syntrophobacteraceae bacterium]
MLAYTLKRFSLAVLVALTVSFVTFMLLRFSGDPAAALAGVNATPREIEFVRVKYGMDRPVVIQYAAWAKRALQGDFGESNYFNQPVQAIIGGRLSVTMTLGGCALAFAVLLGIPMGVLAAVRPNTWVDRVALTISVIGQAMPSFFFGLILIIVFGVMLRWLPISGSDSWRHFVLPSIALGYYATPAIMRLTRSGMLEVLASDYIRTAKAKGLRSGSVLFKHALRNAIIPVVSLLAVQFGFMLGGSLVIETIFAINGVGFLGYESIARADLPMVQAIVLLVSMFYVVLTFLADLLNAFLDPRIRVG